MESTVPPVYGPDSVKKYMEYKLGAFPGGNGVQLAAETLIIVLAVLALIALREQ